VVSAHSSFIVEEGLLLQLHFLSVWVFVTESSYCIVIPVDGNRNRNTWKTEKY